MSNRTLKHFHNGIRDSKWGWLLADIAGPRDTYCLNSGDGHDRFCEGSIRKPFYFPGKKQNTTLTGRMLLKMALKTV